MNLKQMFIKFNYGTRNLPNDTIKYIVIHDTGNTSAGANALMHYNYFNGGDRQSSADFFVDKDQVIQVVDCTKNYSWHCGDGGGAYGITNRNSIGIEMCIPSDGDFAKTLTNTIELVAFLIDKLKLTNVAVVRHYDASRKNCPASLSSNSWVGWATFKQKLIDFQDNKLFVDIMNKYASSPSYWIDNTVAGKTVDPTWVRAIILKIYKGAKSGN